MSQSRVRIACTLGDPNGIGPEVVLKALSNPDVYTRVRPILVGSRHALTPYADLFEAAERAAGGSLAVVHVGGNDPFTARPGVLDGTAGMLSMKAVEEAVNMCLDGRADALVTAPISKEAIHAGGYDVPGHTEFIATQTGCTEFCMMLVSGGFRVALVTAHIPLGRVADAITEAAIVGKIRIVARALETDYAIRSPRIAVLGLNPHAGDGGVLGAEEQSVIGPAIAAFQGDDIVVEGPFAADGFFGRKSHLGYDAIVSMYHDQGLVAFKALTFGKGVNVTAGLPIVRTSPDHGTAFDIAGTNQAQPFSFQAAIEEAASIVVNRMVSHKHADAHAG